MWLPNWSRRLLGKPIALTGAMEDFARDLGVDPLHKIMGSILDDSSTVVDHVIVVRWSDKTQLMGWLYSSEHRLNAKYVIPRYFMDFRPDDGQRAVVALNSEADIGRHMSYVEGDVQITRVPPTTRYCDIVRDFVELHQLPLIGSAQPIDA